MKKKSTETKVKVTMPKRSGRPSKRDQQELGEDLQYWGDESRYARDFAGDVAFHTTRFDNDWN